MRGAGGTPGGVGQFLFGLGLAATGAYMLTSRVAVSGGYWTLGGYSSFGVALIPFLLGTGLLFFDGGSTVGWLLLFVGAVVILAGVLLNLQLYFHPTSLFDTLVMAAMLAGGLGLLARSLRARA